MATTVEIGAYRALLVHMREPVVLVSPAGTILASNEAAAETLGVAMSALEGGDLGAYSHEPISELLRHACNRDVSFVLHGRDGQRSACDALALTPDVVAVRLSGATDAAHRARAFFAMFARLQPIHLDSDGQTLEDLARTLLTVGMTAVGSGAGGLFLLDANRGTLELVGSVGYPPNIIERYRLVSLATAIPLTDSVRTSTPVFLATSEDYLAQYPEFTAAHPVIAERAMACIPLEVDGRCIGTLGLGFPLGPFTEAQRASLIDLGRQCAYALDRARNQHAGGDGRPPFAPPSRLERLHAFTGALARAITPSEVAEVAVDAGIAAAGAQSGGLWLVADDGLHVHLARAVGPTGPLPDQHARVPIDRPSRMPILDAIKTSAPVWIESCAQLEEHYPDTFRAFSKGREASLACLPLVAHGRCMGGLVYQLEGKHPFPAVERAFFEMLAWYAAQALDRTRLFSAERLARGAAEASHRRSAFLADSDALLASVDSQSTLAAVASMAVPRIADWCIVELEEERQRGAPPFAAHVDPSKVPFVLELSRRVRAETSGTKGLGHVTRTGESVLYPVASNADLEATFPDQELAKLIAQSGLVSSMVVPISARGKTLGAILLNSATPGRHYDEHDLAMAEDLGRKVGLALENGRLYHELRDAGRTKDTFLAMLSHELRTPLVPIVGMLDLMRMSDNDAFGRERELIERNVRHLVRLVDDLLDVSRITRNKVELRRTLCETSDLVTDAIEIANPAIQKHGHRLSISVPSRDLRVLADPIRLTQAIANLLINAAKYTPIGGVIEVIAAIEAHEVVIRVRDSGIGMDPDMLSRIFDMFVQAHTTLDRAQGGLGIGLTVVKSMVELHGGTVTAHSAGLGQGSEFAIRLPGFGSSVILPPTQPRTLRPNLPGTRVLLVEDNYDAAEVLGSLLEAVGCAPLIVHDGASALAAAPQFKPELALLDLGLPVMDGYELARRLREIDRTVRLIAITGYGQDTDRARSRAAGFDDHLVKPIELDTLRRVLAASP